MKVRLLYHTPLEVGIRAIRRCYLSESRMDTLDDNLGENDKKLLKMILDNGHLSTLEHISYTFDVEGVSRALLIELERHRIGVSLSVQSTRWTLNKILKDKGDLLQYFNYPDDFLYHMKQYVDLLMDLASKGYKNDVLKYFLLESFKTSFIMTVNVRSLRHLFELRMDKRALKEFREFSFNLFDNLPPSHKIMFEDIVKKNGG